MKSTASTAAFILLACCGAAFMLGGCKSVTFLQGKAMPPPMAETHNFLGDLASEYQALAEFATEQGASPQLAGTFYGKAERASQGENVSPEVMDKYKLPAFAKKELEQARGELTEALDEVNTPVNARMLAMAQVKFDCWLAYQPYQKREGSYIGCREAYRQAMAHVDFSQRPAPREKAVNVVQGLQTIHFASEKMTLDHDAHEKIAAVAEQALSVDDTLIILTGHSKTTVSIEDTSNNAVRRIIAVRNALYQNGIDPEHIEIQFEKNGDPMDVGIELSPGAAGQNS